MKEAKENLQVAKTLAMLGDPVATVFVEFHNYYKDNFEDARDEFLYQYQKLMLKSNAWLQYQDDLGPVLELVKGGIHSHNFHNFFIRNPIKPIGNVWTNNELLMKK